MSTTYTNEIIPRVTGGGSVSPLTTKGDVHTFSTLDDRLPVGTNNQIITADSTAPTGLKWVDATKVTFGATGKDRARPSATTNADWLATDSFIYYKSDGSKWYVPGIGGDKPTMGSITGGGGFSDVSYMASAAALSVCAGMNPGTFALLFYVNTLPGAVNTQLAGYSLGNITNGWALKSSSVNANQMACLFTGLSGTGNIQLTGTTLSVGPHCFIFNYNAAATISYCLDGGSVSTAATVGAFTAPTAGSSFGIGRFLGAAGLSASWFDYIGLSAWNSVLSNAEMQVVSAQFASFRFGNNTTDPDFFQYASGMSLAGAAGGAAVWPIVGAAAVRASYISGQGGGMNKANY